MKYTIQENDIWAVFALLKAQKWCLCGRHDFILYNLSKGLASEF